MILSTQFLGYMGLLVLISPLKSTLPLFLPRIKEASSSIHLMTFITGQLPTLPKLLPDQPFQFSTVPPPKLSTRGLRKAMTRSRRRKRKDLSTNPNQKIPSPIPLLAHSERYRLLKPLAERRKAINLSLPTLPPPLPLPPSQANPHHAPLPKSQASLCLPIKAQPIHPGLTAALYLQHSLTPFVQWQLLLNPPQPLHPLPQFQIPSPVQNLPLVPNLPPLKNSPLIQKLHALPTV